jgi:hypothetical protein
VEEVMKNFLNEAIYDFTLLTEDYEALRGKE